MGLPIILTVVAGILFLTITFYIIARKNETMPYHADPSAWLQPPIAKEPDLPPASTTAPDYRVQVNEFEQSRKVLEETFFKVCSESGRPRGLRWKSCDFESTMLFVVENHSLNLHALVPVVISFEAIEGGPMEDMEAVSNLRVGSALFVHTGDNWATRGDVIYNLSPDEAFQRYAPNYTAFDVDSLNTKSESSTQSETLPDQEEEA